MGTVHQESSQLKKLEDETQLSPLELRMILGLPLSNGNDYSTIEEALYFFRNAKNKEQEYRAYIRSVELSNTLSEIRRIASLAVNENLRLIALKKWLELASSASAIKEVYEEAPYGSMVFYLAVKKLAGLFGFQRDKK